MVSSVRGVGKRTGEVVPDTGRSFLSEAASSGDNQTTQ